MHMSITYASQHNATAQIAEVVASVRRCTLSWPGRPAFACTDRDV
jgi:hypothetical protein